MPRTATDATPESDAERVQTGSTKKTYATKKRRAISASESDVEEVVKEVSEEAPKETPADGEEEVEEEEEYEIEKIIDAKKGQFVGGRMGYLVKWKGYEEKHNSWVDERDAGNAQELIEQFWAEKKKGKAGPRKSEPVKPKSKLTERLSRKSLADLESSAEPEVTRKRGRPRKEELPSDKAEGRDKDEDEDRATKKQRKSNGVSRQDSKRESDDEHVGNMKKHMKVPSWEELVGTIDTVEREEDGELFVFFTLKSDRKRVRENSRLCAEKFPQKLIMFYESNLRWKTEDEPAEE